MVKKMIKYSKFVLCIALILSLVAPSYAALSASDGSAFVTKAEFDSALADFNSRLTTFEAGINSKIDSQVTSYLDRNGIWNGKNQTLRDTGFPIYSEMYQPGSGGIRSASSSTKTQYEVLWFREVCGGPVNKSGMVCCSWAFGLHQQASSGEMDSATKYLRFAKGTGSDESLVVAVGLAVKKAGSTSTDLDVIEKGGFGGFMLWPAKSLSNQEVFTIGTMQTSLFSNAFISTGDRLYEWGTVFYNISTGTGIPTNSAFAATTIVRSVAIY